MNSRKALVVGIHHWHSPLKVGTHYITQYLLERGFETAYISAPVTPLHRFLPRSEDLDQRRATHAAGGVFERQERLWHYVPSALLAPDNRRLLSSSLLLNHCNVLSIPNVVRKVKSAGFDDVDLLFLDSIYQPFWLTAINYQSSAYRLADNTSGFTGFSRAARAVENRILCQVDMVFTASRGLGTYAETNGAKSVKLLSNGVDLERFTTSVSRQDLDLPEFKGPVAIYIGAFEYWFDHQAIVRLAEHNPQLTVLLIGPMDTVPDEYRHVPNVKPIGAVPAENIPAYLSVADIGLIPFKVAQYPKLLKDVNPLKLYEYMAAGLPVVSSRWKGLEELNSPVHLVDSRQQFVETVSAIIEKSSSGSRERHFASQHDWQHTLEPLGNWIEQNIQG